MQLSNTAWIIKTNMVQALYTEFGRDSWVWRWLMLAPLVVRGRSAYRKFTVTSTGNCGKIPVYAGTGVFPVYVPCVLDSGIPVPFYSTYWRSGPFIST